MSRMPPGWAQTTTDTLFTFVTSGSRGWARYYADNGAVFIRVGNLQRTSILPDLTELQRVSLPKRVEGIRTKVAPNDILISITADLGRVALMADLKEIYYINQHVALARPVKAIDPRYLAWYLSSDGVQRQWAVRQRGVTRLGLGLDDIRSVQVPIPPRAEQDRIVAAIEEQLSRLDSGVAALERARQNLKQMRETVVRAAVSGGLIETDLSIWATHHLADIADIASGQTPRDLELAHNGPIPFYKVGDMNISTGKYMAESRGYIDLPTAKRFGLHIRPPGTIIFPKRGGAIATNKKRILQQPSAYDLNTIGLIPHADIDSRFLYLWISSIDLSRLADGSNVPQINHGDLSDLQVRVPPKDEQNRIVAVVDAALSLIDGLEDALNHAERRSGRLRSSILAAAFSGKLVPHDPTDEPASALLERIAAERASSNGGRRTRSQKPSVMQEEVTK